MVLRSSSLAWSLLVDRRLQRMRVSNDVLKLPCNYASIRLQTTELLGVHTFLVQASVQRIAGGRKTCNAAFADRSQLWLDPETGFDRVSGG